MPLHHGCAAAHSIGGNAQNGYANQDQQNKAYAAFGSVNLEMGGGIKLRGGLRYTQDDKDFVANRVQAPPFSPVFIGQRTASTSASNVSGDFSATWALNPTTNAYGRVATGFRSPSIQGRLLFGDQLSAQPFFLIAGPCVVESALFYHSLLF